MITATIYGAEEVRARILNLPAGVRARRVAEAGKCLVGVVAFFVWIGTCGIPASKTAEINKMLLTERVLVLDAAPNVQPNSVGPYESSGLNIRKDVTQRRKQREVGSLNQGKLRPKLARWERAFAFFREGCLHFCDGAPAADFVRGRVALVSQTQSNRWRSSSVQVGDFNWSYRHVGALRDAQCFTDRQPLESREKCVSDADGAQRNLDQHRWRVPALLVGICLFYLGTGLFVYSADSIEEPRFGSLVNRKRYFGLLVLGALIMFGGLVFAVIGPRLL
jgi:hypothetical protein